MTLDVYAAEDLGLWDCGAKIPSMGVTYGRGITDSTRASTWKEKKMPKVSRSTASSHLFVPGYSDSYEQEIGDWTVTMQSSFIDMDMALFLKGAPNDQCQATHMGYVLTGKFGIRKADGVEEFFEPGDAFIIEPGHTPIVFAGCEWLTFTPTEEAKQQAAVMMPNMMKYAEEHGIELPEQMTSS